MSKVELITLRDFSEVPDDCTDSENEGAESNQNQREFPCDGRCDNNPQLDSAPAQPRSAENESPQGEAVRL